MPQKGYSIHKKKKYPLRVVFDLFGKFYYNTFFENVNAFFDTVGILSAPPFEGGMTEGQTGEFVLLGLLPQSCIRMTAPSRGGLFYFPAYPEKRNSFGGRHEAIDLI